MLNYVVLFFLFCSEIVYATSSSPSKIADSNKPLNSESIKEQAREFSEKYDLGMKQREEAIKYFKEAEKYKRMAAWFKRTAPAYNMKVENLFSQWLRKKSSKGEIENYAKIISTPQLMNKYFAVFKKKFDKIEKKIHANDIKSPEDVTDYKMWLCTSKICAKLLTE